jgi:hypothetical protein
VSSHEETYEVVKWYTRARRFPQLIGKTPDGAKLWGGPYTYTQVVGAAIVLVVGVNSVGLWGQFGLIANAVILLSSAYGTAVLLGRLPVGSRNPLSVGSGLIRALSSPTHGNFAGRSVRIRRPHRVQTRLIISHVATHLFDVHRPSNAPATAARVEPQQLRHHRPRSRPLAAPSPAARRTALPALTAVQLLLASTGAPSQED